MDPAALRLPSYVRANTSFGFESADGGWSARGWVRNLANREVMNFATNLAVIDGGAEIIWEEPRTYGVSVAYRWR